MKRTAKKVDKEELNPERYWEHGWDGHERAQRLRLARIPMSEKLSWLEMMHRIVNHMARRRNSRKAP